jgi:pyruvate dehydrogenase E2 component (dihydrolipoamide acetyltransferase)
MTSRISAVTMPRWGMTMTEGKVTRWRVAEGGTVAAGADLVEIETTKITNVLEAAEAGVLRRIVLGEGGSAGVGSLIAVIAPAGATDAEIDAFVAAQAGSGDDDGGEIASGPTARVLEAGAHRLNVLSMGGGPKLPVIFIHGFGGDLNSWMFNQPAIAEQRPTHALDLPGHGQSSQTYSSGSVRSLSEAVIALLDALKIQKAHLVGHSMGGAIALRLATAKPDRVASVFGVAPGGLGPELNRAFIDGFVAADRRPAMAEALGLLFAKPDAVSRAMVDEALRYKRQDGTAEALKAIVEANFTPTGQKSGLGELLPVAKVPIRVVWGVQDRVIPVAHGRALPSSIPVTVLEDAGHMPHMEKAGEVNRLLAEHLAALD